MKKITQLLALILSCSFVISCSSDGNTSMMATTAATVKHKKATQSKLVNTDNAKAIDRFSSSDLKLDLETMDMIAMQQKDAEDADAAAVMNINAALMGAEKEAQLLDVNFSMSEEPVENGMFIFSIESPDQKNLTLEMFDEEGYAMAANNKFDVNEGNNYKALNVKEMDNGAYIFRLKDDAGKELVRTVSIDN